MYRSEAQFLARRATTGLTHSGWPSVLQTRTTMILLVRGGLRAIFGFEFRQRRVYSERRSRVPNGIHPDEPDRGAELSRRNIGGGEGKKGKNSMDTESYCPDWNDPNTSIFNQFKKPGVSPAKRGGFYRRSSPSLFDVDKRAHGTAEQSIGGG